MGSSMGPVQGTIIYAEEFSRERKTMELRNRIVGAIGATALLLGMTAGLASAQVVDTDSTEASVIIDCAAPLTVEIGGSAAMADIDDIFTQNDTSTAPGGIGLTVDMGCYWGPWQVNASVTNFSAGPGRWFSADHFSLQDATVETYFLDPIDTPWDLLEPTANDAYFWGAGDEDTILETSENWFFFWQLPDTPAPFVTTASYTGHLTDLPIVLPGTYTATLTVELATD